MRILFVCTGNECRSPVAERLTYAAAERALAGSPELAEVEVLSAGLDATPGRPIDSRSASALVRLGGNPEGFAAQRFSTGLAKRADLLLTMSRNQRTAVLTHNPRGLRSTFTLVEAADLARRADLTGLRLVPLQQRARALAVRLHAQRAVRHAGPADDIVDPIGQRSAAHEETAETIAAALRPLTDVLFTSIRPGVARLVPA